MSKRVIESTTDSTGKIRQTTRSNHWMAHWMRASSNSTADRCDDSSRRDKELDHVSTDEDLTNGLEASGSVKQTSVIETKSLRMSSKSLGNGAMCSSHMKHGEDTNETKAIRPIINYNLELGNAMECKGRIQSPSGFPAAKVTSFREYHSFGEGTSKNPLKWVKSCVSAEDTSPATSTPFLGSSTEVVPYHGLGKNEFDKGKALVYPSSRPSIVSNNQFPNTKLRIFEQGLCQKHNQSACLICEGKMGSHLGLGTSTNAGFREGNRSLLLDAPTTKDMPTIRQDWLQKMQNFSEATAGGRPRFSQTTRSLFITKNADINISKENDVFRSPSDVHNLPSFFGQANKGVQIQPLSSSSNSEGQGNVRDIGVGTSKAAMKNESSAETDPMDMDYLKEGRPTSAANSSRLTKGFNIGTNSSPRFNAASSREVEHPWKRTGLPDINLELPASPAAATSSENAGPGSSRTESLEMDVLLAHAEHPTLKSNLSPNSSDPTTRWVKRLKQSTSDSSGRGTKSSNLAENLSRDKKRGFFRNVLKNSITSSESTPSKILGKEPISSDRSQKEDEEGKELLLSHSWIKRWLRNGSQISEKKPEAIVVCEPKTSVDDFQKKQFPSIAAMALMGKAMSGYQSCELQKRGNFIVWNSKAF
ncbi:hypothetical protein ACS0TY_001701 [Phlomoides rotata]